jgi:hypothetical protein
MTIDGVGEITALTWVLEIGDQTRFSNSRQAISYCGLCSAQKESAGKEQRGPISQKRNRHLQTILIEAAKLAPYWNPDLAVLREKEFARGNRNRATLAIARKLVEYLLAVDRRGTPFITEKPSQAARCRSHRSLCLLIFLSGLADMWLAWVKNRTPTWCFKAERLAQTQSSVTGFAPETANGCLVAGLMRTTESDQKDLMGKG